jgi:hypothetical protein
MDQQQFWAKLDKLPVETVQQNYDLGLYAGRRKDWAEAWLKKQKRKIPWHKKWWGGALIAVAVAVALIIAALTKYI